MTNSETESFKEKIRHAHTALFDARAECNRARERLHNLQVMQAQAKFETKGFAVGDKVFGKYRFLDNIETTPVGVYDGFKWGKTGPEIVVRKINQDGSTSRVQYVHYMRNAVWAKP